MSNLPPRFLTVHASATFPSMDVDAATIRKWHLDRNFNDIGYHYVIKRDGTVQQGRPEHRVGAHVGGHNTKNIGICMVGGLKQGTQEPEDNFTDAQYRSLTKLLTELHERYPDAVVMGHNEFNGHKSRGCPCFDIKAYRDYLREAWNSLYAPNDWMDHNWKEGVPHEWNNPSSIYDEIPNTPQKK